LSLPAGKQYLEEGEVCMDFSGKRRKWIAPNPKMFGMSCQWPQFSCNFDLVAKSVGLAWQHQDLQMDWLCSMAW
jgi:hypothetical protein